MSKYLLQQRIKKRLELLDAYQKQVENKKMLLRQAKEEEDIFRQKVNHLAIRLDDAKVCRR